jgi:hypothetical protein
MVINDLDVVRMGKGEVRGSGLGDFLARTIHE